MTITIHYSRLCQFLVENKIVLFPENGALVTPKEEELVQLFVGEQPLLRKITYFDLQLFVKNVKKNECWFSFLLRVITFGLFASSTLCKSTRLLKQWERHNSYLWDGSKRLIEIMCLDVFIKERKVNFLEGENVQLQGKLSEVKRSLTIVLAEFKEQCHRWDIVLTDSSNISALSKHDIIDSIKLKLNTDLNERKEMIAHSVFQSNLSCCLSYADKFTEEMNRNNTISSSSSSSSSNSSSSNSSSSSSYSHIRQWLLPLQSQPLDPTSKGIELHWINILLDLCMLKGFLLRRLEESEDVDMLLPLSTMSTMNVTKTTLKSYSALIKKLLVHFKSSLFNQLTSMFYESESNTIMDHLERINTLTILQRQLEAQRIESNERMETAQKEYKITKQAGKTY